MKKRQTINNINRGMTMTGADELQAQVIGKLIGSLSPSSMASYMSKPDLMPRLMKSYMQKLENDGRMIQYRDIKKMDILDTTQFLLPPDNSHGLPDFGPATAGEQDAITRMGWYSCIPCFEKGALKVNKGRYIAFEIIELNPEGQEVKIQVRDYLKPDDSIWQMGVGVTITAALAPDMDEHSRRYQVRMEIEDSQNFEELYTIYSAKDLGWSKSEYQAWKDVVVENSHNAASHIEGKTGTDQCG